jgi:DNA-binding PadR family transcriptional regulator
MLELAALGLLQREPLHGYKLKQELELFVSSCISVNYGAIYPLLKRLEERGYILGERMEKGETGISRKIYQITEKGRDRWREKMLELPKESWVNSRSRFGIKFFFFSDLRPEERQKLIDKRLIACRLRLKEFEDKSIPGDPYRANIWKRHLWLLRSEIDWLEDVRSQEGES